MPVKIEFSADGKGIEFISTGVITGDDIIDANNRVYTQNILERAKYKLVDRTGCTDYRVTKEAVQIIANQDKQAATVNPDLIMVLISTTPVQYGVTRMWQAYMGDTGFRSIIFNDRETADRWLNETLNLTAAEPI